jgi:glutathione synthase/RimK-type ligase-like ATP-grasp enzyme
MANNLKKQYIGAICNRDLQVLNQIKNFLSKNYNIILIDFMKHGLEAFNEKYYKKRLKKYPIVFLIVKLTSQKENQKIYDIIKRVTPNIPILNSLFSVRTCESRKATFQFIERNVKKVNIPKFFKTITEAKQALNDGFQIIVKLDSHNIPDLPKNDRILGIAKSVHELAILIERYDVNELFFQQYLGKLDVINKVYVIGDWIVSIISHNRLQNKNLNPLELIHIRSLIDEKLKRRIKRLGKRLGMPVFGVDYIETMGESYIVDVNDFPSFRNIPEGVSLISDQIYNLIQIREEIISKTAMIKS